MRKWSGGGTVALLGPRILLLSSIDLDEMDPVAFDWV